MFDFNGYIHMTALSFLGIISRDEILSSLNLAFPARAEPRHAWVQRVVHAGPGLKRAMILRTGRRGTCLLLSDLHLGPQLDHSIGGDAIIVGRIARVTHHRRKQPLAP